MTSEELERERPYLQGVAYRLLGSAADAEDVVQEALVRGRALEEVRSPRAMLTTIVTRLCLDELRSARRHREAYVGPWLPEPVLTDGLLSDATAERPDDRVGARESASMAFLLLLERLSPNERAVFVLREVLDLEFAEIAEAVGKSEPACRQLLHRARAHVAAGRRRFPQPADQSALASRFLGALAEGDVGALIDLLVDDAISVSDHGGNASAAQKTIVGRERVARFLLGLAKRAPALGVTSHAAWVNGVPAIIACKGDAIDTVIVLDPTVVDGAPRIQGLHVVRNPDKLGRALRSLGA